MIRTIGLPALEAPRSKSQIKSNSQIQNLKILQFEYSILEFSCDLMLVFWNFKALLGKIASV